MTYDSIANIQHDFEVTINNCNVDPGRIVEVIQDLLRRKGVRFLIRVPKGEFTKCLDIIRRIHSSFIFISLTVVEAPIDHSNLGNPIVVKPLNTGVRAG